MMFATRRLGRINEKIHAPIRLAIVTLLSQVDFAEFSFMREHLSVTDGNLSSHLRVLEDAGYTEVVKEFVGKKPKSTYRLTDAGRSALSAYITVLEDVIASAHARDARFGGEPALADGSERASER